MTIGLIITVVSIAVVLSIVGTLLLIRYLFKDKEEYDLTTKYGTSVKLSELTKDISIEFFEIWSDSVVNFWYEKKGWGKEKSYKLLSKIKIKIYDEFYLERAGIKVSGIFWPSSYLIEVTTMADCIGDLKDIALNRVSSLFRHEVSHLICESVGNIPPGENFGEDHHKLFAEEGLGA